MSIVHSKLTGQECISLVTVATNNLITSGGLQSEMWLNSVVKCEVCNLQLTINNNNNCGHQQHPAGYTSAEVAVCRQSCVGATLIVTLVRTTANTADTSLRVPAVMSRLTLGDRYSLYLTLDRPVPVTEPSWANAVDRVDNIC